MKFILTLILLSSFSFASGVKKEEQKMGDIASQLLDDKKEEDCDEKAKEPVKIPEPEEAVLGLGTAGCTIE